MKYKITISTLLMLTSVSAYADNTCGGIEDMVKNCQAFTCEAINYISDEEKEKIMQVHKQMAQVFGMLPGMPGGQPIELPDLTIPDSIKSKYKIIGWDSGSCHIQAEVGNTPEDAMMYNCFLSTDEIGAWVHEYETGQNPAFMDLESTRESCKVTEASQYHAAPAGHQPPVIYDIDSDAVQIKKEKGNDYEWYE